MAKKSAGKLAGLAALGAATYLINEKLSKGKGKSDDAGNQITSNYTKKDKKVESDGTQLKTQDQSIKESDKSSGSGLSPNSQQASGVLTSVTGSAASAPVQQQTVKVENLPGADKPAKNDRNENYSNEGRDKPEIKTEDKSSNKPAAVTIGGVRNDKPILPSSKKVQDKAAARKASISTDEMKNRSRIINPKTAPFRKANIDQIPGQNRSGPTGGERVSGTELSRNLSNTAVALSPLTGGTSKVAAEFAMGRNAAKALQGEGKLSAAGQRLKNMEEVRNVAMPGRNATVTNPNAWAAGPKGMDKIAQAEARAAAAEARAAAAEAKRNSKDPFMSFKPGSDFKRGGMTKMASGGMTASRRGDGIASRGKTRCKMY